MLLIFSLLCKNIIQSIAESHPIPTKTEGEDEDVLASVFSSVNANSSCIDLSHAHFQQWASVSKTDAIEFTSLVLFFHENISVFQSYIAIDSATSSLLCKPVTQNYLKSGSGSIRVVNSQLMRPMGL